uniref:Uncharacterized protein n=1 Tax=Rhizophora mucronata TaxID=61149 RepID=A0A2P2QHV4_RHIMU
MRKFISKQLKASHPLLFFTFFFFSWLYFVSSSLIHFCFF